MDDKGFIFTVDAALALIVVIVLTATITAYTLLPYYQGEDHQHLEALADSILETMEQSGQLRTDAVYYSSGDASLIAKANADLNSTLGTLVPSGIAYRITMTSGNSYVVQNTTGNRNLLSSNDIATKVKVISGPQEGWVGRAYYKIEQVQFEDQTDNAVTTLWNFHNWLQNFNPWNNGLDDYKYWGSGSSAKNIAFYVPSNGTINGAKFLIGCSDDVSKNPSPYGANFILNGNQVNHNILSSNFGNYIYSGSSRYMYNYMGNITSSELYSGTNNFYVKFTADSTNKLPWFSIIGNYTTSMQVPIGITTSKFLFPDIAGVGKPKGSTSVQYDLNTGVITYPAGRTISWNDIKNQNSKDIDTSTPFTLTDIPSDTSTGSAVASVSTVYLPPGTRLFDAFTVINPYGGVDRAIVQVKNSYGWQTIFTSFGSYTDRNDGGYGNLPGIINIAPYLTAGSNTVRVIIWDDVSNSDYDLVGLTNCYSKITYSQLPIRWDTFAFTSHQYSSVTTQSQNFNIDTEAQEALLFVGAGLDTRSIKVTVKSQSSSTTTTLYDGPVPYYLNLGDLDAAQTNHIITKINANGSYSLIPGKYTLGVTVTPGTAYESGDFGGSGSSTPVSTNTIANPEIFSGTRISVIYPKFLSSIWVDSFASNPTDAKTIAANNLTNTLRSYGYTVDTSQIKTEAIYTGNVPNSIPVRLELWKQ
ncbi:hypothetical protein [Methanobacterium sp. MBAC-LM]|uniref:hypothetical protein n=1 Tax=Methanobacterium sp. MBAC-LM TaxID=3412034 RepID=UPI003C732D20